MQVKHSNRIMSLEALRGIAFLGVLIVHTEFKNSYYTSLGSWSVSVFFVLSGFVSVISEFNKKPFEANKKNNLKYAINKLKKIYPLYVISLLATLVINYDILKKYSIFENITRIIANVLIIQEWLPFYYRSINPPTWFLSTIAIFYLIFPYIISKMRLKYSLKKAKKMILLLFLYELVVGTLSYAFVDSFSFYGFNYSADRITWMVYEHPLSRIADILVGCNLGYIFCNSKDRIINKATLKEGFFLIVSIVIIFLSSCVKKTIPVNEPTMIISHNLWWEKSIVFLPLSIGLVYLFAYNQGKISNLLINKLLIYASKNSLNGFLLHMVVYEGIETFRFILSNDPKKEAIIESSSGVFNITLGLFLTFVCSQIWIVFEEVFIYKKYDKLIECYNYHQNKKNYS